MCRCKAWNEADKGQNAKKKEKNCICSDSSKLLDLSKNNNNKANMVCGLPLLVWIIR